MNVLFEPPPNFAELCAAFPQANGRGVVFTWGSSIYVPNPVGEVPKWTKAHEAVHYAEQTDDLRKVDAWWKRYIKDPEYRLAQELPAHRAEFKAFCRARKDGNERSRMLMDIARRLSGPFYGGLITLAKARLEITK